MTNNEPQSSIRLWADFTELVGDEIWTSLEGTGLGPDDLTEGRLVELWNHDGDTILAKATKVDFPNRLIRLLTGTLGRMVHLRPSSELRRCPPTQEVWKR